MALENIPAKVLHKCDRCGAVQASRSESRVSGWARLSLDQGAEDYQGYEVADGSRRWDFCRPCRIALGSLLDRFLSEGGSDG